MVQEDNALGSVCPYVFLFVRALLADMVHKPLSVYLSVHLSVCPSVTLKSGRLAAEPYPAHDLIQTLKGGRLAAELNTAHDLSIPDMHGAKF